MSKLKLFTSPSVFPNPQRIRLMMHEKGIVDQVEEHGLDMMKVGEQRQWRHLKRNPWGETPALELPDGTFMSEAAAIGRYLDLSFPGRKVMGESPAEQALDMMWDDRIWVQILYRLTTMFHVLTEGLGFKLEPVHNAEWGQYCRLQAQIHAGKVDAHLADGRDWLLGGTEPTFADITLCTTIAFSKFPEIATPLDERFEHLAAFWQRWKDRDSFRRAYGDGQSGLDELKPARSVA